MDSLLNIIVVEDHDALRKITVDTLCGMGHEVIGVDCAEAIDDEVATFPADLMIIDLNLPGEDGISLARRLRTAQPNIGIIMLTARRQIDDKRTGYENGADIYLTKPTSIVELGAAVESLGRRVKRSAEAQPTWQLSLSNLCLHGPEASVDLSAYESAMLASLARASGQRLAYWQLIELAGKPETEVSKSTLEVQVVRLRKKMVQAGAGDQPIKAVRGHGYQLCVKLIVS
jgi:DNA-binding response OmpR family regulator